MESSITREELKQLFREEYPGAEDTLDLVVDICFIEEKYRKFSKDEWKSWIHKAKNHL
jgi:hypothetical protein